MSEPIEPTDLLSDAEELSAQSNEAASMPEHLQAPGDRMAAPPVEPLPGGDDAAQSARRGSTVIVRYGLMHQVGDFSHDLPTPPVPGAKAVVRTERGVELGDILVSVSNDPSWRCISSPKLGEYIRNLGPDYPFTRGGKVLRLANAQDIIDFRHLENSAKEERAYCRQQIRELNLQMKLVTVEHLLGGERVIFYFASEARIDFRELVHRLASQFRTRIEMRQVGARDEARLVADYERCGQRCCCQEYMKDLKPVSMRMAKTQKATLDPSKISGRCSRLMCCLRYEDAGYEELRKKLPRKNTWVRTEKLVGKVIDAQIITQLVRLLLTDNTLAVVANEEILERDVPIPTMPAPTVRHEPAERPQPRLLRESNMPRSDAPMRAPRDVAETAGPEAGLPDEATMVGETQADPAGVDLVGDIQSESTEKTIPGGVAGPADIRRGQERSDQGGRPRRRRRGGRGARGGERRSDGQGGAQGTTGVQASPGGAPISAQPAQQQQSQAQQPGGEGQNRRRSRHRHRSRRGGGGGGANAGGGQPNSGPPAPTT